MVMLFCVQDGFLLDVASHSPGLCVPCTLHLLVQHNEPDSRPFAKVSQLFDFNVFHIFNNAILLSNQAHFQDVPPVLELDWDHCCPSSLQIRPQTGLPVGPVPALWAIHPAVRQAVFPLRSRNMFLLPKASFCAALTQNGLKVSRKS